MKKIVFAVALVAAALATACSGNKQERVAENDYKSKIENCTNADSLAVYVSEAQAYVRQLVNEGKTEEAKKFVDELSPVVAKQDQSLQDQWGEAVQVVEIFAANATDSAADVASNTVDTVQTAAANALNAAADKASTLKEKAETAASNAAEKVSNAAEDVKAAGENAVQNVKDGAANVLNNAADKLKK